MNYASELSSLSLSLVLFVLLEDFGPGLFAVPLFLFPRREAPVSSSKIANCQDCY